MRLLTLTQPWATLIALLAKLIETRSWSTDYRGSIAIHAGVGLGPVGGERALQRLCQREPFWTVLRDILMPPGHMYYAADTLPRGEIVAVAELVDCCPTTSTPRGRAYYLRAGAWVEVSGQERAFGDYSPGRFAWLLADVRPLRTPMPYRGARGLRTLPADVEQQIRAQLAVSSASAQR